MGTASPSVCARISPNSAGLSKDVYKRQVQKQADYDAFCKEKKLQNVVFLLLVPKEGRSYSLPYSDGISTDYYKESVVIYAGDSSDTSLPATIAHETVSYTHLGVPSCAHRDLIDRLRGEWGFNGYFVSDCGALADMHMFCLVTHTAIESAALALKAGCDLNCGQVYLHVLQAYYEGKVTEEDIDRAVICLMAIRYKLGMFDPTCKYNEETDYTLVECDAHRKLAYEAAVRSVVMLKNNGVLPLKKDKLKTVAVIGPNAENVRALEGNYNGNSADYRNLVDGVKRVCGEDVRVLYALGCPLFEMRKESCAGPRDTFAEALSVAEAADAVIMCMGIDPSIEGEEGDANNEYGAGDKPSLAFPGLQQELLERIKAIGKPMILVTLAGGALDLNLSLIHI